MNLSKHMLPVMLTLITLCGVTIARAVERSADGFSLVQSPIIASR